MRKLMCVLACAALTACEAVIDEPGIDPVTDVAETDELALSSSSGGSPVGTFKRGAAKAEFSSREVEPNVFEVTVKLNGMTLRALLDVENGVSALDGFASDTGADTQLLDGDRALLSALYASLNAKLPRSDSAAASQKYLRRAIGLWAQHPSSVELQRTVMGEQQRGYTMLCSYAKCNGGANTGSCNGAYNWYSYARHDCNKGGFDNGRNQQIAQLGDHYSCSGDEWYINGSTWVCGEPDHWYRPKVVGNCFGRCGGGCGGDTQYTLDATNHDGCVRNGHMLASLYCDDQFASASDDELFAPNCY